jgi:UDP-N-acetylmuramoylalanine--D-glutamate ligase
MNIVIAGYGQEGEASYRYYSRNPDDHLTIVDQKTPERSLPVDASVIIGEQAFNKLEGFDLIIRTAGLAPHKIHTDGKIWSATNEFFAKCPAPIIGATGSKGKGTTAGLIDSILREAGKKVWFVGNVGSPALDVLEKIESTDIVVYELSSFQLWDIEKSPHIAVVLYIEQEHLDVHSSMDEYVTAKANITKYQTNDDKLIYNQDNQYSRYIAGISKANKIGYIDESSAHIRDGYFYYGQTRICEIDKLGVIGEHNQTNACAAIDAAWNFTNDLGAVSRGLADFRGLPHRLQFVREVGGVRYYDDSIATTPSSAIAALRSFDGRKVIILGGSSKGSDFTELGQELTGHDVSALLIGDEANKIAKACQEAGFEGYELLYDVSMAVIVDKANKLAKSGDIVLLSPASASFGMFKNYIDRGEQFTAAVNKITD